MSRDSFFSDIIVYLLQSECWEKCFVMHALKHFNINLLLILHFTTLYKSQYTIES